MNSGEITDSFPGVKARNVADSTNTNVDTADIDLDSAESTTLSNVGEPDPGDGDKITHIHENYILLSGRSTGRIDTTEGQSRSTISATTDTKNTAFSDTYETHLNTKSQTLAKTSEVKNFGCYSKEFCVHFSISWHCQC